MLLSRSQFSNLGQTKKSENLPSAFCTHTFQFIYSNLDKLHRNLFNTLLSVLLTFILRLVLEPVNESTLTLTLWPLLTTSATLATRPSLRSSEMWTKPSHRFLHTENNNNMVDFTSKITDCWLYTPYIIGMHMQT